MHGLQKDKDVGPILKAIAFAACKHRNQKRKGADALPYINHPIAVADVLWHEGGVRDPVIIAAALLHDTIEDRKTTAAESRQGTEGSAEASRTYPIQVFVHGESSTSDSEAKGQNRGNE
jgi:(p)ppGpp synthase/HD superfamily hydrolase